MDSSYSNNSFLRICPGIHGPCSIKVHIMCLSSARVCDGLLTGVKSAHTPVPNPKAARFAEEEPSGLSLGWLHTWQPGRMRFPLIPGGRAPWQTPRQTCLVLCLHHTTGSMELRRAPQAADQTLPDKRLCTAFT